MLGSQGNWKGAWSHTSVCPFFDLIVLDELARCAAGGIIASLFAFGIGLPPVIAHGSKAMKDLVVRDVVTGIKVVIKIKKGRGGLFIALLNE